MARLTGKNAPIYLPYKSTNEIIREAIEQHESEVKVYGWAFFAAFFFLLMLHDAFLYCVIKVL
jgi:hypothetical protein